MVSLPLKQQYGPTLGELLAPRWTRLSSASRGALIVLGLLLLGAVVAVVLSIEDASYSHGGPVPFSFQYKGLFKSTPDPGSYVKVVHRSGGRVEDSFGVAPLVLPSYQGSVTGALPLYAAGYIRMLNRRYGPSFQVDGEGKTRVNTVPGYNVFYSATVEGQRMFGRDVLITPEGEGVRDGVVIEMLTSATENKQVSSPTLVASTGLLKRPLETFTFE